jgi:hypothetical protein
VDRRVAGQGEKCVLLVKGQQFGEIVETHDNGATYVLFPDGLEDCGYQTELLADGHVPVAVTKVIKGDGTWMYFAPGPVTKINPTGTQWYTRGGVFV